MVEKIGFLEHLAEPSCIPSTAVSSNIAIFHHQSKIIIAFQWIKVTVNVCLTKFGFPSLKAKKLTESG